MAKGIWRDVFDSRPTTPANELVAVDAPFVGSPIVVEEDLSVLGKCRCNIKAISGGADDSPTQACGCGENGKEKDIREREAESGDVGEGLMEKDGVERC
jgi:phage gp45-like